jgi:uncharacterized OB-fold protein
MSELFEVEGDEVRLSGGQCAHCGHVFYPYQAHGCESCGRHGADLKARALSSRGAVEVATVVHLHHSPARTAPFVVAQVRLDDGPVVRALATDDLAAGAIVHGSWRAVEPDAEPRLGFRFTPIDSKDR